jgi:hypothetical protein
MTSASSAGPCRSTTLPGGIVLSGKGESDVDQRISLRLKVGSVHDLTGAPISVCANLLFVEPEDLVPSSFKSFVASRVVVCLSRLSGVVILVSLNNYRTLEHQEVDMVSVPRDGHDNLSGERDAELVKSQVEKTLDRRRNHYFAVVATRTSCRWNSLLGRCLACSLYGVPWLWGSLGITHRAKYILFNSMVGFHRYSEVIRRASRREATYHFMG